MPPRASIAIVAALALASGCGGSSSAPSAPSRPQRSSPPATPPPPSQPPPSTAPAPSTGEPSPQPRLPRARGIVVPRGFRAQLYGGGLRNPTAMAFGPDGRLYVTENGGTIAALRPGGRAVRVAGGFDVPLGLAWRGRALVVSQQGGLVQLRLHGGRLGGRRTLVSGLPYGRHQQDAVLVGAEGRLLLGSGSTCDVCEEADARSAAVLSLRPDGRDLQVLASGLRNPYGLALDPSDGALYATVNGQDDLDRPGDPEPADMLVRIRPGASYGWPRCWPSARLLRMEGDCAGVTRPVAYLEPHSSADGLAIARGGAFGHDAYVAEWGQYDSEQFGRRVVRVTLHGPNAGRVRVFASGFPHPLAAAFDAQGALLVADWERGIVVRIQRRGRP